jgi:hypothetical protein
MAYTTEVEVEALVANAGDFGAATKPTSDQLTVIIDEIASEINTHLAARGITVPFVSSGSGEQDEFATFLSAVNAWGATASALKSRYPDVFGPGEIPAYAFWEKKYQAALDDIDEGVGIPTSVASSAAIASPSTMNTRNPDENEDLGLRANPSFLRSMVEDW